MAKGENAPIINNGKFYIKQKIFYNYITVLRLLYGKKKFDFLVYLRKIVILNQGDALYF